MRAVPVEPGHRLNVLLTGGTDDDAARWFAQLPRLLEPQGVRALRAGDVDSAVRVIETEPVHAAVVDLSLPLHGRPGDADSSGAARAARFDPETSGGGGGGGLKLLRVIRRLDPSPPAVVLRGRRFDGRADDRVLTEALKLDAFSVVDHPVQLDQLLDVLRRLLQRHYGGHWPTPGS